MIALTSQTILIGSLKALLPFPVLQRGERKTSTPEMAPGNLWAQVHISLIFSVP